MLLFTNIGCCSQEWKMTPSLKSVHHTYGLREVCCSSTKESVHVYRCLKCEGYVVQDSTHDALQISPELFSPIHTSLIIKKKCTRVLPATFSPKGNPKAFVQLHRKDRVFCNKKKKKKQPGKSQQKETTSVGCKKTKRKANKRPGRGPAIAEKYNMELEIRGTSAAKHMSQAVPILSVCYSIGAS